MAFFQAKHKIRTRAGLDIGTADIKLVEIAEGPAKPLLTAFGCRTPVTSSREEFVAAIRALVESAKIASRSVAISVSGSAVVVRFITMPKMTREEMAGAIRFEAEKHIPFNINDCVTDFQVLRSYDKEKKCDILLVAAKKELVEGRVRMVLDAGLGVDAVDVDGFALANAFLKNYPQIPEDRTILLLDLGSALTNLTILKGGTLCLVRDIAIGGKDLNAAAARAFGIDPKNTDELRRAMREKAQETALHIKPVLGNLLDEIRLSCSYYENQCGRTVDEVYASGGAARVTGLPDLVHESFGLKPVEIDVFQAIDTMNVDAEGLGKVKSSLAVAVGLACR